MSLYLIKFTPREPYFFGNEKTFGFPGANVSARVSRYYISGEEIPAQTSLMGTLRYILLPVKKEYRQYSDTDKRINGETVGYRSFKYGEENTFGKIKGLSPVFIINGDERIIVTPYDHKIEKKTYTPFSEYKSCGLSDDKVYPTEYDVKEGISHTYMNLDGKIYSRSDIFKTDTRIGINRGSHDFFKKDYVAMKNGFAFGAYVELDDGLEPPKNSTIAYMGQGKSLFTVEFIKQAPEVKNQFFASIAAMLRNDAVYCLSYVFVTSSVYKKTKFAITDLKDYRAYTTNGGDITKDSLLYKVVKAGSIFLTNDYKELKSMIADPNAQIVGYNTIISKEEKYE